MKSTERLEFANNVRAAVESRAPRTAWMQIVAIAVFLSIAAVWAHWATLDEVTSGEGRVIPSSKLQVVQTLDGGIVLEAFVREGDIVEPGQLLLRIDDTEVSAKLGELTQKQLSLKAQIARLEAEAAGADLMKQDPDIAKLAPIAFKAEQETFTARRDKLAQDISMLVSQQNQREQELAEYEAQHAKYVSSVELLQREVDATRKLVKSGAVPELEFIRLQRQMVDAEGEVSILEASIPKAKAAVEEARAKVRFADSTMKSEAHEDLGKALADLAIVEESLRSAQTRVVRTSVKAPVRGIVNRLGFTTIGAVVQPGFDLVEIVPLDDTLRIEVEIGPRDVAFIVPGQSARIRLTAYDYQLYGILEGKVERISADTFTDQKERTFYKVIVETDQNFIENQGKRYPILPGMVANVDVLTGQKTVLDYVLSPILTIGHESMRER
jgi:membrane fusion protein, adhesin transport system